MGQDSVGEISKGIVLVVVILRSSPTTTAGNAIAYYHLVVEYLGVFEPAANLGKFVHGEILPQNILGKDKTPSWNRR